MEMICHLCFFGGDVSENKLEGVEKMKKTLCYGLILSSYF